MDPDTNEVRLRILKEEEWKPVLSLHMIILALEIEIGKDPNDIVVNNQSSFDELQIYM